MRVMHVMAGADEGGAENIMLESVLALAEAGHDQHVVTRPGNMFRTAKFAGAGIGVDTASFNPSWPFPTRKLLGEAISSFRPDVIEYWMGRAGQFAPAAHRARSIAWYGGYYKLARFRACDWHVGLTIDLLRHIREQGVSEDRSAIIHTYADFQGTQPVARASLTTPEGVPVALGATVGALSPTRSMSASMTSASLSSAVARSTGVVRPQVWNASDAARTAASTSSALDAAALNSTAPTAATAKRHGPIGAKSSASRKGAASRATPSTKRTARSREPMLIMDTGLHERGLRLSVRLS
jgi:hypothetical protein